MFLRLLVLLLLLLPVSAGAQSTNSRTFSGTGTSITATGSSLNTNITNGSIAVTGSVTVSGTVAATQSGTWTVQPGNTANTTAWKVDGSAVTQPVSGTVSITANSAVNVAQFGGTNVATGTGTSGVGVPRVTVSSDSSLSVTGTVTVSGTVAATQSGTWTVQPGNTANTTAWKVDGSAVTQPVSGTVSITANSAVNVAQLAGTTTDTNSGSKSAGTLRVVLATDQPALTNKLLVTPDSVALPANQSVNVAQVAGAAPSVTNPMPSRLTDGTGFIDSDVIGSIRYLKTSTVQDIELSASNSSTTNLASGASFTGTSQTTLGVGAIQVNLFSDQNATIQVQQAQQDPGTSWDVVDSWTYTASSTGLDAARTIQATGASVRVIVTNTGPATSTTLRLTTAMCPVCDSLPRGLTQLGNLRTALVEPLRDGNSQETGVLVNPFKVQLGGLSSVSSSTQLADPTQATVVTLDPFGKLQAVSSISDGSGRYAALRGKEGAQVQDAGLVVQESIAPNLQCPYVAAISQTANTQLVTNPGGQSVHVCSFQVVSSAAQNVSLVEGTGTTCGTGTRGLYGGSTASVAFAANGGGGIFSDRIIIPMQVVGDNLCLLQSAANNVSGIVTYGIY